MWVDKGESLWTLASAQEIMGVFFQLKILV
jgi:hypothetical protein